MSDWSNPGEVKRRIREAEESNTDIEMTEAEWQELKDAFPPHPYDYLTGAIGSVLGVRVTIKGDSDA
jgi:hypothetical protein